MRFLTASMIGVWVAVWASTAIADAGRWAAAWPDTDFSNTSIDLDEVFSGGPPKDGIPPIDHPEFGPIEATDLPQKRTRYWCYY